MFNKNCQRQLLSEPSYGRMKRIRVYLVDKPENLHIMNIIPKNCRNWNEILKYITESLKPDFGAVRRLYELDSEKFVRTFDELKQEETYIAMGTYGVVTKAPGMYTITSKSDKIRPRDRTQLYLGTMDPKMSEFLKETEKKGLTVFYAVINGEPLQIPQKVVLTKNDIKDWEPIVRFLNAKLDVPEGVDRIATIFGEILLEPGEIQHGFVYVAMQPLKSFINLDYLDFFKYLCSNYRGNYALSMEPAPMKQQEVKRRKTLTIDIHKTLQKSEVGVYNKTEASNKNLSNKAGEENDQTAMDRIGDNDLINPILQPGSAHTLLSERFKPYPEPSELSQKEDDAIPQIPQSVPSKRVSSRFKSDPIFKSQNSRNLSKMSTPRSVKDDSNNDESRISTRLGKGRVADSYKSIPTSQEVKATCRCTEMGILCPLFDADNTTKSRVSKASVLSKVPKADIPEYDIADKASKSSISKTPAISKISKTDRPKYDIADKKRESVMYKTSAISKKSKTDRSEYDIADKNSESAISKTSAISNTSKAVRPEDYIADKKRESAISKTSAISKKSKADRSEYDIANKKGKSAISKTSAISKISKADMPEYDIVSNKSKSAVSKTSAVSKISKVDKPEYDITDKKTKSKADSPEYDVADNRNKFKTFCLCKTSKEATPEYDVERRSKSIVSKTSGISTPKETKKECQKNDDLNKCDYEKTTNGYCITCNCESTLVSCQISVKTNEGNFKTSPSKTLENVCCSITDLNQQQTQSISPQSFSKALSDNQPVSTSLSSPEESSESVKSQISVMSNPKYSEYDLPEEVSDISTNSAMDERETGSTEFITTKKSCQEIESANQFETFESEKEDVGCIKSKAEKKEKYERFSRGSRISYAEDVQMLTFNKSNSNYTAENDEYSVGCENNPKMSMASSRESAAPSVKSTAPSVKSDAASVKSAASRGRSVTSKEKSLTSNRNSFSPSEKSVTSGGKSITSNRNSLSPSGKSVLSGGKSISSGGRSITSKEKSVASATGDGLRSFSAKSNGRKSLPAISDDTADKWNDKVEEVEVELPLPESRSQVKKSSTVDRIISCPSLSVCCLKKCDKQWSSKSSETCTCQKPSQPSSSQSNTDVDENEGLSDSENTKKESNQESQNIKKCPTQMSYCFRPNDVLCPRRTWFGYPNTGNIRNQFCSQGMPIPRCKRLNVSSIGNPHYAKCCKCYSWYNKYQTCKCSNQANGKGIVGCRKVCLTVGMKKMCKQAEGYEEGSSGNEEGSSYDEEG